MESWSGPVSVGNFCDSAYEYLFKVWLLLDKTDPSLKELFDRVMMSTLDVITRKAGEYTVLVGQGTDDLFDHLTCFIAGTLALAASNTEDATIKARYTEIATELTRSCVATYQNQPSGIGPESSRARPGLPLEPVDTRYLLRPETVESVFYMWRLTHDEKYRDWNWAIAQAIEKQCRWVGCKEGR